MSISRHHNEWLSLVPNSGPFLSLPVLTQTFPQGLDAHDAEHARRLRLAFDEWDDNQLGQRPDLGIHRAWVEFVLGETLGYDELLAEGQEIPQSLKSDVAEYGETLRPDWIVNDPATKMRNNRKERREKWWQYAEKCPALYRTIAGLERVLVVSLVSNKVPFAVVDAGQLKWTPLSSLDFHGGVFPLRSHAGLAKTGCFLQSPLTSSMTELSFLNLTTPARVLEGRPAHHLVSLAISSNPGFSTAAACQLHPHPLAFARYEHHSSK